MFYCDLRLTCRCGMIHDSMVEPMFSGHPKSLTGHFEKSLERENISLHSFDSFIIPGYTSTFFPVYPPVRIHIISLYVPHHRVCLPYLPRHHPNPRTIVPPTGVLISIMKSIHCWGVQRIYSPSSLE